MDEIRQVSEDVVIKEALKWWVNILSSKDAPRSYEKEFVENYGEIESISPNIYKQFIDSAKRLDRIAAVERKVVALNEEQVKKFIETAVPIIRKEIKERGIAYLYTDEYAMAGGTLALIAYKSNIPNNGNIGEDGKRLATAFPEGVEMYVSREKIDVRYDGKGVLYTVYEAPKLEKENNVNREFLQKKMDEYNQKKL